MNDMISREAAIAAATSCPDSHWGPWVAERLRALPAVQPKVKPLVWCGKPADFYMFTRTAFGLYEIGVEYGDEWFSDFTDHKSGKPVRLSAWQNGSIVPQAAAQADYEVRILSALEPAAQNSGRDWRSGEHQDWEKARAIPTIAMPDRSTFDAMCAMRDAINEYVPMPSLESDLLQGPENSVFCATVAEAVIAEIRRLRAAQPDAALTAQYMADWSDLPDVYVTSARKIDGMFWEVTACSVPMAIGPEVRLTIAKPQPDAAAIKSAAFQIAILMELHAATRSTTKAKAEDIERGIRALINNPGKEVMPVVPHASPTNQPDTAPAGLSAGGGDWPEDYAHENGNYLCECVQCGNQFFGHKRRVTCKTCAMAASPSRGS